MTFVRQICVLNISVNFKLLKFNFAILRNLLCYSCLLTFNLFYNSVISHQNLTRYIRSLICLWIYETSVLAWFAILKTRCVRVSSWDETDTRSEAIFEFRSGRETLSSTLVHSSCLWHPLDTRWWNLNGGTSLQTFDVGLNFLARRLRYHKSLICR